MRNVEDEIKAVIDNLKPYLINDGGNVNFIKFEDGIVYIEMQGACANCGFVDVTIKDGIENILIDEIPEVKGVINIG